MENNRDNQALKVTRLSWAGILLEKNGVALLIDPLENTMPLQGFLGKPRTAIWPIKVSSDKAYGLVTHIHPDHFDIQTLKRLLGAEGQIHGPAAVAASAKAGGLTATTANLDKSFKIGSFEIIAVHAMDWRGDDQVSWVIRSGQVTIFHGGDTIWHGYWWQICRQYGPFKLAFLPINGVIASHPNFDPSGLPSTLTPTQAAIAARLLKVELLCPIHYETFHNPPLYIEEANAVHTVQESAAKEGVRIQLLQPGESIEL